MLAQKSLLRIAVGSIVISIVVLGLKAVAYWITGSVALYSDALESIINVVTAITAFGALWFSLQPADANHPYGHHKAEYLSAVLEGVLIVLAAISIFREAVMGFLDPHPMMAPVEGLALNLVATAINAGWALVLIRTGRRNKALALTADGRHLMTDVVTSVGVFAGLVAALVLDMPALDPILAGVVALNIIWMGVGLMRESLGGLLDEAVPPDTLATIKDVIARQAEGAIEAHDIRTRQAGPATFIEFHLVVDGSMSVSRAHDICDCLERALQKEVEGARVSIHVEPHDKAKHQGIIVV